MKRLESVILTSIIGIVLLANVSILQGLLVEDAMAKQSKASSAVEKKIESKLETLVKNDYTKYCGVWAKYKPLVNNTVLVYNGTVNCPTSPSPSPGPNPPPNPNPTPVSKVPTLDTQLTFRIGAVGDVDCKPQQTKEWDLMKQYGVQGVALPGDYEYTDGKCITDGLTSHGYHVTNATTSNVVIAVGNHDSCSDMMKFMKQSKCWYHLKMAGGKVEFFVIDANSKFGVGSEQYNDIKSWLASSTAQYKIVVIHQPFITVSSTHPENGQFETYQPLFIAAHVTIVLEAHNHNWQYFNIDGIDYWLVGTGTHDIGDKMYPTNSNNDGKGHTVIKSFADKNGITLLDLNIANNTRIKHGYFVDINNNLLYNN